MIVILWMFGVAAVAVFVLWVRWLARARPPGGPLRTAPLGWRVVAVVIGIGVMRLLLASMQVGEPITTPPASLVIVSPAQ
jgi:hypothetical protein